MKPTTTVRYLVERRYGAGGWRVWIGFGSLKDARLYASKLLRGNWKTRIVHVTTVETRKVVRKTVR